MERGAQGEDYLRELSLQITNSLLRVEKQPTGYAEFNIINTDTHFFEKNWGLKLFEKPLLAVNFSDEDLDEPEKFEGDVELLPGYHFPSEMLNQYIVDGWDDHINIYQGNTPYMFGVVKGSGDFGDHETSRGFSVFRSHYNNDVNDEKVVKDLDFHYRYSSEKPTTQKGDIQRKIFIANIETGKIIYNKPLLICGLNKSEHYFNSDFFANGLLHAALSGKYFVCIGRSDRIGAYLEHKEKFDFEEIDELIGR